MGTILLIVEKPPSAPNPHPPSPLDLQVNLFAFDNPQDARDPGAVAGLWPDDDDDDDGDGGGDGGGGGDDDARGDGASLLSSDVYKGTLASLSVFLVLGTLCGVLGALFVRAVSAYVALRNRVLVLFDWVKSQVFGRDVTRL